jgi:quercetin dioxygenase-like cupin family protein
MSLSTAQQTYAAAQQVAPRWFLHALGWVKASAEQTGGRFCLVEELVPSGFASAWHVHHSEDESFYVVEGNLTIVLGDQWLSLGPGGYVFGPRDIPHAYRVEGGATARILVMTTGCDFANFFLEVSEPAAAPTLPEPTEPDVARLAALAEKHGAQVLGPFPHQGAER